MELHIQTAGLCLIVPQTGDDGEIVKYHLLLPETGQHPHFAVITYPGAQTTHDLSCSLLDLSEIWADRGAANLSNVIDVGMLVGGLVPRTQFGSTPNSAVSARVTIPVPTWTMPGEIAPWQPRRHNGVHLPVFPSTHHMTWVYENFDPATLRLRRQQLHACGTLDEDPLPYPIPTADGVVCISILHLPTPGTVLDVGEHSPHFHMYGKIFDPPRMPAMVLKRKPRHPSAKTFICEGAPEPIEFRSETAYNCMLGKSGAG